MGDLPVGVQQLMSSRAVRVKHEFAWFKRVYSVTVRAPSSTSVSSPHRGRSQVLRIKNTGNKTYVGRDANQLPVCSFKLHDITRLHPSLDVLVGAEEDEGGGGGGGGGVGPPVTVLPKGGTSSSLLVLDECRQQRLKIRPLRKWFTRECVILGQDDTEIGSIKRSMSGAELVYPADLDVRFKVAIIGAIILRDRMDQENDSSS